MRHALHERTGDSALSATESRIHDAPGHPPPPPCARRAVLASVRSPFTSGVRRPLIRVTGGLFPFRAWAGWQGARAAGAGNPVGLVGVVVCVDFIPKSNTCKTGWFFRERVVGRSRTSSFSMCHCRFQVYQRLRYCCDQPEKRCQELPEIDCEGALCKRQALALLRSERKLPTILLLCPMATLLSAQRADGAAQRECVGHRPRTRTASGVAVTLRRDGTRAGERHDGDWYHERHYSCAARPFRMFLVSS